MGIVDWGGYLYPTVCELMPTANISIHLIQRTVWC
jgi:hypothetical protein